MWAHSRSTSTAFLRMMIERGDVITVHEPWLALTETGTITLPAVGDGTASARADTELRDHLIRLSGSRPVFVKEVVDYRYPYLFDTPAEVASFTHTFLVRDPRPTIASHYAMKPTVTSPEIGFERLAELFDLLWSVTGRKPLVLRAERLVGDPQAVVRVLRLHRAAVPAARGRVAAGRPARVGAAPVLAPGRHQQPRLYRPAEFIRGDRRQRRLTAVVLRPPLPVLRADCQTCGLTGGGPEPMDFVKLVAAGNDFILVEGSISPPFRDLASFAKWACQRQTGIGADGVLLVQRKDADHIMVTVANPDGSIAKMCGNGARCAALHALRSGATSPLTSGYSAGIRCTP